MRHAIANALYRLGAKIDRPARYDYERRQFGDEYRSKEGGETVSLNFHATNDTSIRGSFDPGKFTYAALTIGDGQSVTIFLRRITTLKLLSTLKQIEAGFDKYGESRE